MAGLTSVRDNWREELAQLGFRLAGIGPLAGCSAGFGQLTGEDASILEIRPGRIGLTEIRGGRIEDVRLLPVSQSAPTAEQCQSVLDQKSPHAIWLAGTHPDLTGLAEHMAASLEQPVKVLEPAKDPGVHPPGSMTPLIGAAASISSAHLDKSPVAAVVAEAVVAEIELAVVAVQQQRRRSPAFNGMWAGDYDAYGDGGWYGGQSDIY